MKSSGFCIFEYDENEETLITFIFPSIDDEMKSVIQETAHYLIKGSNSLSLFTFFKNKWLYFEGIRNPSRNSPVRLYGICLLADDLHPALYSKLAQVLCATIVKSGEAPKVLRGYLLSIEKGSLSCDNNEFDINDYSESCFEEASFDVILDRAGSNIPLIWQALVSGHSVTIYSPDLSVLQACAVPILSLCRPGFRQLLPLVMDSSEIQTTHALSIKNPIWCTTDVSALNGHSDLTLDLSTRTVKLSPQFQKETGREKLVESLKEVINNATASENSVADAVEEFNNEIVGILNQVKVKYGDITSQSIQNLKLSPETKMLLSTIAANGVFNL